MSSGMMDTERGGESTQYESIDTATKPHSKQGGQMGNPETQLDSTTSQNSQETAAQGEKTAENVRYGQNISESGVGGMTTETSGSANQGDGYGRATGAAEGADGDDEAKESRRTQGYGPGSGVGG